MAQSATSKVFVSIGGDDISELCDQCTFSETFDAIENQTFGHTSRRRIKGLTDGSVTLRFHQDFDAGKTFAILNPKRGDHADAGHPTGQGQPSVGHEPGEVGACVHRQPGLPRLHPR